MIALIAQSIPIYCTLFCAHSTISFLIGSCWLIVSFVNDITNDLPLLNVGGASNRNEITKRFCRIVEFYMDVKQLSKKFHCKKSTELTLTGLFDLDLSLSSMLPVNLQQLVSFYGLC